jgi:hypothetical protein
MNEAIETYRRMSASEEFRELERIREKARNDEVWALGDERRRAERRERAKQRKVLQKEREKWQAELAGKDAELADKDALIAQLRARLGEDG